jgi:hypothetical protein
VDNLLFELHEEAGLAGMTGYMSIKQRYFLETPAGGRNGDI